MYIQIVDKMACVLMKARSVATVFQSLFDVLLFLSLPLMSVDTVSA